MGLEHLVIGGGFLGTIGSGALNGYLDSKGCNTPGAVDTILTYGPATVGTALGGFAGLGLSCAGGVKSGCSVPAGIAAYAALGGIGAGLLTGIGYVFGYGAGKLTEG